MPPGAGLEFGPDEIRKAEQADYDEAKWNVLFTPRDALAMAEDWVYGIADGEVDIVPHTGGPTANVRLTVTWLYERQSSDEWLIKRQMWSLKPD
jgi:ketosteroid isomerase-like protein